MIRKTVFVLFMLAASLPALAHDDQIMVASGTRSVQSAPNNAVMNALVSETYEYYEIQGRTEQEMRCQMTENGCTWKDGNKYDSVTSWKFDWNFDHIRTEQGCSADAFSAAVAINFRYPRWQRPTDAPQSLIHKWESYIENLVIHENGHRDMAVEAAAELNNVVAGLPPAPTCAELDKRIQMLCSSRIKKLNADAKVYDATTGHGVKQGALFP